MKIREKILKLKIKFKSIVSQTTSYSDVFLYQKLLSSDLPIFVLLLELNLLNANCFIRACSLLKIHS